MKTVLAEFASQLRSEDVESTLHRALIEEGVLIDTAGAGARARALKHRVEQEPDASFGREAVERALSRTIKQIEVQVSDLRRHASVVLALFSLGVLVILGLVITGFWTGLTARYVQAFAAIVPTGGIWMWYQHIHGQLRQKTADLLKIVDGLTAVRDRKS